MAVQLNLLIHGNPQGASLWCNKTELPNLSQEERSYFSSFYHSSGENKPTTRFEIDWRTDEATGKMISYYHYVIQGNVSEAGGRSSGYVALTLRISEAFTPHLLQVYDILHRLFNEKVIGNLVDKTAAKGYKFRVDKLDELDATFCQWEKDIATGYGSVLSRQPCDLASAKPGESKDFSLDDLWKKDSPDQIIPGRRLVFSSNKLSLQSKLHEQKLNEENKKLQEEMAKQSRTAKNKHDQLEQQNKALSAKLGNIADIVKGSLPGGGSSSAPCPPRGATPYASHNQSTVGNVWGEDERRSSGQGRQLLVILLALLFVSQVYVIWKLPSSSGSEYSTYPSSMPRVEVLDTTAQSDSTAKSGRDSDRGAKSTKPTKSRAKSGEKHEGSSKSKDQKTTPEQDTSSPKNQPSGDKKQ